MSETDRAPCLISAALRHVMDAGELLQVSPDQSWHLAGFGPECARKACLEQSWLDRVLGHNLSEASDSVVELALALDTRADRYEVRDFANRFPILKLWSVESRYDRTGTHSETEARTLVEEAATLSFAIAAELWMDGRVRGTW